MRYQHLFGNTDSFAIQVALHRDEHPHPGTEPALAASWGTFGLWVGGRCLTQSSRGGTIRDSIEWYLLPLLTWAAREAVALFNEEPFPQPTRRSEVATALDWLSASEEPLWSQTEAEEFNGLITRFDWQKRHALWHAFEGAVVPSVMFRRLGDTIEVSWNNETWPPSRRDLRFTELIGAAQVPTHQVEPVWLDFVEAVSAELRSQLDLATAAALPIGVAHPTVHDWKRLIPGNAALWLERHPDREMKKLVTTLRDSAKASNLIVPHRMETLILRHCAAATDEDLQSILPLRAVPGQISDQLERLRAPRPAPLTEPWRDGYDAALAVRETLGWNDDPAPDLAKWCAANHIDLDTLDASSQLDAVLFAPAGHRPLIDINRNASRNRRGTPRFMTAAGLGMVLLDTSPERDFGFVFGSREHWPSAARARAFAAMLLLPVDGIRRRLHQHGRQTIEALEAGMQSIMNDYGTSAHITANHLNHLGFITDDERIDLIGALTAA